MYVVVYVRMCKDMYECTHVCKVVGKVCMYVCRCVGMFVCKYVSMHELIC
ncbi:hypothetical protein Hanom_Chr13g01219201 [Helianthus anomalus]